MKAIEIYLIVLFMCMFDVKGNDWQLNVTVGNITTPSTAVTNSSQNMLLTTAMPAGIKMTCPVGFDLYRNHCFNLSKGRGTRRGAGAYCKKMGGYQTWIDGDKKENIVEDYLKAHFGQLYNRTPFVWLPKVTPYGDTFIWQDSRKNATVYLNKHGYYKNKFLTETKRLKLYMNIFGYAFHCLNKCWRLQSFCEVNPVNETQLKPSVKEMSTLQPGNNASVECPAGFDSFKNYCFFISKGSGSDNFAQKVCNNVGGYQTMINGVNKENAVISYLRANMNRINHYRQYVWLPRIVSKRKSVTWKYSGKDASSFARRYGLSPHQFKPRRRISLMISLSGHVDHCSHCHKLQAFCETDKLTKDLWKSKHHNTEKKRKLHKRLKTKRKRHKHKRKKNKEHKRIERKSKRDIQTEKEIHQNETVKMKNDSHLFEKSHESRAKCTDGFELYRRHCFYLGRRKESIRDTKAACKKVGGHQVDIAGPEKEHTVLLYLKANRKRILHPYPFLWLSTVVGDGKYLTWLDSGKSAKYFLKKEKFYHGKFYTDRYFEKEVYIRYPFRGTGTCLGECRGKYFQPFCETEMMAENETKTCL